MSSTQEVGEIFGEGSGPAHAMLRSPTVLIASVGLWGLNILVFRIFRINYVKVFKHDLKKLKAEEEREDDQDSDTSALHNKKTSESSTPPAENLDDENNDHSHPHHLDSTGLPVNDAITWNRLVSFSASLLFLLHFTTYIWMEVLGGGFMGAIFSFYGSVITVLLLPIPSLAWLQKGCAITFQRTFELINPRCHCLTGDAGAIPRPIPFVDVYFADAMCSLSKVFFDMGMLLHMLSHYPEPVPPSPHNIVIPSACAAMPYLIRARQCLVMHTVGRLKNDPKRQQHVQNAIKYSTSLWPLFLSAYQKCITPEKADALEPLLIVLLTINASYSLYWDIVMDWGMMQSPEKIAQVVGSFGAFPAESVEKPADCTHVLLRPRLRFGLWISLVILVTDVVLRFSWTLRFYHALFPSGDSFVLFTQFLEVFRRSLWNLLRVEWENLKQQTERADKEDVSDEDEEKAPFLPPMATQMTATAKPMTVPAKRPNSSV
jgi:EXS family